MLRALKFYETVYDRAYGGVRCAKCVCDKIKQAFFTEKQQAVVEVLRDTGTESESKTNRQLVLYKKKKNTIFVLQLFEAFVRKVTKVKTHPSPTPSEKSFQKITTDRQHEQSQKEIYSTWENTGKETHRHKFSTSNNFQF